ncbi:hypothetical protein [Dehalobacter sp. TeCB1]|uniref:hypothetical protein n=1 Tax=Dehalobacter sp. TeCB1 TaxID=1843715 RepID=UPI00083B8F41|nr:hypothetical protein [Dehalobacter sp. TeCB1]OCZ51348.1 hypothetical protein A7D23_13070 [Dehalobacter sp. TeCB1]
MRKNIILIVLIILAGSIALFLPGIVSKEENKRNEAKIAQFNNEVGSNNNTIIESEVPNDIRETEVYDKEQMYFQNIEPLYSYFKFAEVETIKQKVQYYIHTYIDKSILDCELVPDSIKQVNNTTTFEFSIKDNKPVDIQVDKENGEIKVSIINSIK